MLPANHIIHTQLGEWACMLDALQEANLALKQRLAEEAKRAGGSKELLETLEGFLSRSLNKDMHVALLRQDINSLERLAKSDEVYEDSGNRQLRRDVTKMCEEFDRLKADFEARFEVV